MEPSRACQPSTVYSGLTGRRPHFTLQPGLATFFMYFLCHRRISVRSLCHSHSSGLTVWHRHTKPTEPLTKTRCRPLFEHARVDNCWEISSARQWMNPLRLIVITANERRFVALAIKDKSLFFSPLLPVTKLVGAAGIRPTADPSLPRPGPFLSAQLGSPGQWGSCVCYVTGCWVYSLDSLRICVYSPPWCSGAWYLFVCFASL